MKALVLVDIQNDFTPTALGKPDGALAVPNGNEVIEIANALMASYELVVATQDWHSADHKSFASQHASCEIGDVIEWNGLDQILWPDHCVQGTFGAEFCGQLNQTGIHEIIRKGADPNIDSYSGFFDNAHCKATGLEDLLREYGVDEIDIMGLATDYCVKFTALDAVKVGLKINVIIKGCRGVELHAGDCDRAIEAMRKAGVHVTATAKFEIGGNT
jgi:nicotinamidase/pyrazinamidase